MKSYLNNDRSKISIIIPCYNYGQYLPEAIDSILNQTYKNYEIIIVNDGSNDECTINYLNTLKDTNPEIKVINKENGGLASARNTGIKESSGDYFVPLDADDKIESQFLEKCLATIERSNASFVYTYTKQFGDTNEIIARREYNFFELLKVNYIVATCLFKRKIWNSVGGYDELMKNWYEDWEFLIRLGEKGYYGKLIPEPLFCYRKHGKTMVTEALVRHDEVFSYIKKKHPHIFSEDNLAKLKKEWNKFTIKHTCLFLLYMIDSVKYKLKAAGVFNIKIWRNNPFKAFFRLVPIGFKRKINTLFKRQIFDISYFGRE